jgi:uncharacterized protein YgiB involved in biofilm formation
MKYKVTIKRVEYYSLGVIVEAASHEAAIEKVEKEYDKDDYLYEKLTDCPDDTDGDYNCEAAKESDIDNFINID